MPKVKHLPAHLVCGEGPVEAITSVLLNLPTMLSLLCIKNGDQSLPKEKEWWRSHDGGNGAL